MSDGTEKCSVCGNAGWGNFVQHGSFMLRCLSCKTVGPVTSWISIGPKLAEVYRAVAVNEDFREQEILAEGNGVAIFEVVYTEAGKGRLVWLQPLATA